jgi:predicted hotdog family 3-hydroxylacyl-ACP dehydratase
MSTFPPVGELVKHKDELLLLDRIVAAEGDVVRSETTIRQDNIFFQAGRGVPSYVGFELMAQTISAADGLDRRARGEGPVIGFLLGCRKYNVTRPFFADGETVTTEAKALIGLSSYDCKIFDAQGEVLASASINVFRPDDPEAFLQAQL